MLAAGYEFVRRPDEDLRQPLPRDVIEELEVALVLLPLLPASLRRQYGRDLLASDASTSFGFGVCHRRCTLTEAEELGRLSFRRGEYVRFDNEGAVDQPKARLGTVHCSKLKVASFSTVISEKARWPAHPGLLECHALLLVLK